jgi:O-antigen/teichoic acid export membrane protein
MTRDLNRPVRDEGDLRLASRPSDSDARWRQSRVSSVVVPLPETVVHETDSQAAITTGSASHKLARNAFFLLVSQAATLVLSLILAAVLGRWLGVAEFGVYYLLVTVSTFAYVFIEWGQGAYLIRESARRPDDVRQLLGGALAFRIAVAIVAALVTAKLVKEIGYDSRTEFLVLLAVLCGLPLALSQAYVYMFRGRDRMDLEATVAITGKALTLAVTVPALLLGGGLPAVVLMQSVGGVGAFLVAVLLARKIHLKAQRPGRAILQELANGGGPIAVFSLAVAVQPLIDVMVLSALVPPEVVGWYGAARNILGVLFVPALILGTASFPELSRTANSVPDLRRVLSGTLRLLLGVGALASVGTFLFADVAVGLIYGRHFDPAVAVLRIFAPIFPLFFLDMLFGSAITAAGKTKEIAVVKVLSVAVSTGLNFLLIPLCQARLGNGGIGLILASGFTEFLMLSGYLWLLPRGAVDRSALLVSLRAAAAAGGAMGIFWVLPSMSPWLAVPACVAVFVVFALASGLVLRTDLDKVAVLVRGKLVIAAVPSKG